MTGHKAARQVKRSPVRGKMNKLLMLILAIIFFIISYSETKDALTAECITRRMVTICGWTKYVWSLSPALVGFYLMWSAFKVKNK
jgi:hypothetical protein